MNLYWLMCLDENSGGDIRITSSINNAELYSIIASADSLVVIELQLNRCVFHHQWRFGWLLWRRRQPTGGWKTASL